MHLNLSTRHRISAGFTLIELLVVVATVAVLAGMLLPALSKTRTQTHASVCLNNEEQLAHAWHLYAEDNKGVLVRTGGLDGLVSVVSPTKNYPNNQWCMGTMDQLPAATNSQLIMDSLLYKYVGNLAAYRCPADTSGWTGRARITRGVAQLPSLRSISMNAWMNPINPWGPDSPKVTNFRRLTGVLRPSETWVTIDESPTSINDGWLICDPNTPSWIDFPAIYHDQGSSLSFADGHAEIRHWSDPTLLVSNPLSGTPKDGKADLNWLTARSTYGPAGPPQ